MSSCSEVDKGKEMIVEKPEVPRKPQPVRVSSIGVGQQGAGDSRKRVSPVRTSILKGFTNENYYCNTLGYSAG